MSTTVKLAECHDTCLDVSFEGHLFTHTANVNPIGMTDPLQWRVDCDCCGTCVRAGFATKAEALEAAKEHVRLTVDEYWTMRDEGLV